MSLSIEWGILALWRSVSRPDDPHLTHVMVAGLRCLSCHRLTLGCRQHWLCGCCETCRTGWES